MVIRYPALEAAGVGYLAGREPADRAAVVAQRMYAALTDSAATAELAFEFAVYRTGDELSWEWLDPESDAIHDDEPAAAALVQKAFALATGGR